MDRELEIGERRRLLRRRLTGALSVVVGSALVLLLLPGWLRPSIARSRIRTARVERGDVEAVLAASGTVVPASEQVVSSPLEARIVGIRNRLGAVVAAGDPIVQLDTAGFEFDRRRMTDQMALKTNLQEQLRLSRDKSLADLAGSLEIKRLDADVLQARAEQNRRLARDGLVSASTLRVAEVEARKSQIEIRQLQDGIVATKKSTASQLAALDLDLNALAKERLETDRLIGLATTRADRPGVVTYVVENEGATVHRGDVIARIADLNSFRVEAKVSDVHSARLQPGLPARVLLDGQELRGRLSAIHPLIEDGAVTFTVDLLDLEGRSLKTSGSAIFAKLRANLRVDVLVITAHHREALRVSKGPFSEGAGVEEVFVVHGDEAVRRRVRFGLAGYDYYEVEAGLEAGDEIIVSDMKDYLNLSRVGLR
jgi:HlyD family secretion protein